MHPFYYHALATAILEDRRREAARREVHQRDGLPSRPERPSSRGRFGAAVLRIARRDHSLTDYPCRLPDGRIGRVAVVHRDGDWALVCRVA